MVLKDPGQYFYWHSGELIPYSLAVRLRMEMTPEKKSKAYSGKPISVTDDALVPSQAQDSPRVQTVL